MTTPSTLEFWYDFSSPFSYLGSTQVEEVASRAGATLVWRPMLLGAVFKDVGAANVPLFTYSDAKRRYIGRELSYWSSFWEVPFKWTAFFPLNTIAALRCALQAGDRIAEMSHALFRAAWVDNVNVGDEAALAGVLDAAGFDGAALVAGAKDPAVKQKLIASTGAAVAAGVFGAPTFIVKDPRGDLLFWGQDRLQMVERALAGWRPAA